MYIFSFLTLCGWICGMHPVFGLICRLISISVCFLVVAYNQYVSDKGDEGCNCCWYNCSKQATDSKIIISSSHQRYKEYGIKRQYTSSKQNSGYYLENIVTLVITEVVLTTPVDDLDHNANSTQYTEQSWDVYECEAHCWNRWRDEHQQDKRAVES